MRPTRVVEVDHVKLRFDLISFRVMQQMVVNNRGEVGILEVVAVDGKTFFDLLLDKIIDDGIVYVVKQKCTTANVVIYSNISLFYYQKFFC